MKDINRIIVSVVFILLAILGLFQSNAEAVRYCYEYGYLFYCQEVSGWYRVITGVTDVGGQRNPSGVCGAEDYRYFRPGTKLVTYSDYACEGQLLWSWYSYYCVGSTPPSVGQVIYSNCCLDRDNDGYTTCAGDCNDSDSAINPGATELCGDGIDNDCDAQVDERCQQCDDNDNDGYSAYDAQSCPQGNDCNENDPAIYPGAPELCDGKDNNCDGQIDETCEGCSTNSTDMGSSANLGSGGLYYTQSLLQAPDFTLSYNSIDSYTGPLGKGWTHSYDITITQGPGASLSLMKGDGKRVYFWPSGGIYSPEARSGEYSTIVKNADGTYTQITKDGTTYTFNSSGRLISIRDRNNNTTALTYSGNDLTGITDPSDRTIQITTSSGMISSITDPDGRVYSISYTGDFLSTITDPSGNIWQFRYDGSSRMLTKTDPNGYTTTYTYDASGRIVTSTDPEGKTKTIAYDPTNSTATVTEKDGGVWTYKYDPTLDVPLQTTDPQGNITTYTYDSNRNLISKTEPDGGTTTYTYDANGNMTSQTDPLGNTTTYTYNEYGEVTSIRDPEGNTTTYEYDSNGNLTKTTDPTGATTQYQYDSKGNITQITDANGQTTHLSYDQYNNLISITDPTGATTSFTYDAAGNMISQTDASGAITRFEYNSLNQLIKVIDPQGNITAYTYDANGNRVSQTDANRNTTYYEYNFKGQLIKVKDALSNIITYSYGGTACPSCGGGGDKLTSITDVKGQTTIYQYDTLGRLIQETGPLGNSITYSYDSKGNITSKTDAKGSSISYTYDSLGRLLKKKYPDNSEETFTYDARGKILTAISQYISYTFTYNAKGNITSITDSSGRTVSYAYDSLGNKTRTTYPDGSVINYTYDSTGRLVSIINGSGRTYSYQYNSIGQRTKLTYPNGVTTTYLYDSSGRLTNLLTQNSQLQTLNSFIYTYDNIGNRLTKATPGNTATYTYDKIYRLTEAIYSNSGPTRIQNESYTYDAVGNRLTSISNRVYTYDAGNRLINYKGKAYIYDNNGSLTMKTDEDYDLDTEMEGWTYTYDYENRLIKVVKKEQNETRTITFKYDPFGRRIEKRVESVDRGVAETRVYTYVYDDEDIIIETLTKTANGITTEETTRYIHGFGIDESLAIEKGGGIYYYHADGLGSVTALTDGSGNIVQAYEYDSFGNLHDRMNAIKQPYTYTGREWDKDTGLYYYRARYYNPEVGRFISKDPFPGYLDNPQTLNLYQYVGNNPIKFSDPLGLDRYLICEECKNLISKYICKRFIVPEGCKEAPEFCCEVDFKDCIANAENESDYLKCIRKRATCYIQTKQQPPAPLKPPPGWKEYPNPPGRGPKYPDPRFENLLNLEGEIR